jgi:tRNA (adenine57-N1/adenine58-N1)-methyltransferase
MWSTAREIAPGDLVIIWLVSSCVFDRGNLTVIITKTRDVIQPLLIKPGKDFNSKYGNYRHADLVGIPYGSKVGSRNGKGFVHVLRPTPELWTMALPHRTQILYMADIAFITSYLNIKRGSRVVEAGAYLCCPTLLEQSFWSNGQALRGTSLHVLRRERDLAYISFSIELLWHH